MAIRKKTAIEKFFSINQHRKKWGANKFQGEQPDYAVLKVTILHNGEPSTVLSAEKSLEAHIDNLKGEFSGKSALLHYHASLIVLIRREISVKKNYQKFCDLWAAEEDFLLQNLDIRWLVSAADTFADHSEDAEIRNVGMMVTLLINTIKLYETERVLQAQDASFVATEDAVNELGSRAPLFDGLRCFAVGRDDTLRNLFWRIQNVSKIKPTGQILTAVYDRLQKHDTAFSRFRKLGPKPRTAWWK